MIKKILCSLVLFISFLSFGQFKVTGYFDAKLGLGYAFSEKVQAEIRVYDNLNEEFNTSLNLQYKIFTKERYNLSIGFGVSLYPFSNNIDTLESFFFPLMIEIIPFKEVKNLSFVLESAYHTNKSKEVSGIRNSIGIRYKLE